MQFETKQAGALTLQAVNQQALLDTILEMGDLEALMNGNVEALLSGGGETIPVIGASNRILTYVFGWGVENTPPPEALETLHALGKPTHLLEIARANWLRYLVLSNEEASDLLVEIVKLTFGE